MKRMIPAALGGLLLALAVPAHAKDRLPNEAEDNSAFDIGKTEPPPALPEQPAVQAAPQQAQPPAGQQPAEAQPGQAGTCPSCGMPMRHGMGAAAGGTGSSAGYSIHAFAPAAGCTAEGGGRRCAISCPAGHRAVCQDGQGPGNPNPDPYCGCD